MTQNIERAGRLSECELHIFANDILIKLILTQGLVLSWPVSWETTCIGRKKKGPAKSYLQLAPYKY